MPRRVKLTADITASHPNASFHYADVGTVDDVSAVRVKVSELPWLHRVDVDFMPAKPRTARRDSERGYVTITISPTDENQPTVKVVVYDDGQVILNH